MRTPPHRRYLPQYSVEGRRAFPSPPVQRTIQAPYTFMSFVTKSQRSRQNSGCHSRSSYAAIQAAPLLLHALKSVAIATTFRSWIPLKTKTSGFSPFVSATYVINIRKDVWKFNPQSVSRLLSAICLLPTSLLLPVLTSPEMNFGLQPTCAILPPR